MARRGRRWAAPDGQPADGELRSRDLSGIRDRGISPLLPRHHVGALADLVRDIGDPVWVCGETAAPLHGFDGCVLRPPFHLLVLRGRNITRVGHVVHTTTVLPLIDQARVGDLLVTSPTRTIIDLAATHSAAVLTTAVDSALRDGRTSEDFLHRRIVELRGRGRYGLPKLLDVINGIDVTRGGHSWLERRFLQLANRAGWPRPLTQQVIGRRGDTLIRVDCRFPGTPVVVELLGYRFHRSTQQMRVDAERMNRMVLDGLAPLQFTYLDVTTAEDGIVRTVTEALAPYLPRSSVSPHRASGRSVR